MKYERAQLCYRYLISNLKKDFVWFNCDLDSRLYHVLLHSKTIDKILFDLRALDLWDNQVLDAFYYMLTLNQIYF